MNSRAYTLLLLQSKLPSEAKPLCFILYADKTKLSSFGTATAYPVYARLGNLPAELHNSSKHGGGQLVGWLPIVCVNIFNSMDKNNSLSLG